jgi:hypothetical protein
MIFCRLENEPSKAVPVAMTLIVVGLSILTIGISWNRFVPIAPHIGTDWNDFFRGMMFGLGITLEIGGVTIATRAAVNASKKHGQQ